jgi:excisionase family DNA binding protein
MEDDIFTVEKVAEMLGLHPKTVRKYIVTGKLRAKKIGKEWRILSADLHDFIGKEKFDIPVDSAGKNNHVISASETGPDLPMRERIQVTSIVDIFVKNRDEATRLSNSIVAVVNAKDQSYGQVRVDHIFYETELKVRFIIWGDARFTGELLTLLSKIS